MPKGNAPKIRVRMYRQGLGDCFLLTFTSGGKDTNMLVDCGILQRTKGDSQIMKLVAADIKQASGSKLDVVVVTHEHWDHISGFAHAEKIFRDSAFVFNEVWVGWTEKKGDPKVEKLLTDLKNKKRGVRLALEKITSPEMADFKNTVSALVDDFFGTGSGRALGLMSGENTWRFIMDKAKVQPPRFCTPGEIYEIGGLPGIRFYILGPPTDSELFKVEEPTRDETYRQHMRMALTDSFLAAVSGYGEKATDANMHLPFDGIHRIETKSVTRSSYGEFFKAHYGFGKTRNGDWRRIDEDWLTLAGNLALNIDGITNNTCLAFAIEFVESGKVMIFPGDAQYGNWEFWKTLEWYVKDKTGKTVRVTAADLLKRAVFYKVGHHGSHNATMKKSGLELMESSELVAMIPTNQKAAKVQGKKDTSGKPKGWKMPEPELMQRLEEKTSGRVVLADEFGPKNDLKKPFKERCERLNLTPSESKRFLGSISFSTQSFERTNPDGKKTVEPLYVDYVFEV